MDGHAVAYPRSHPSMRSFAGNTAVGSGALQNNDFFGAGVANFNDAVGAFALNNNIDGTTLLASPRFSLISSPMETPPLVMSRSRLMTRPEAVLPTTMQQLAVRRSSVTLMAVITPP